MPHVHEKQISLDLESCLYFLLVFLYVVFNFRCTERGCLCEICHLIFVVFMFFYVQA